MVMRTTLGCRAEAATSRARQPPVTIASTVAAKAAATVNLRVHVVTSRGDIRASGPTIRIRRRPAVRAAFRGKGMADCSAASAAPAKPSRECRSRLRRHRDGRHRHASVSEGPRRPGGSRFPKWGGHSLRSPTPLRSVNRKSSQKLTRTMGQTSTCDPRYIIMFSTNN